MVLIRDIELRFDGSTYLSYKIFYSYPLKNSIIALTERYGIFFLVTENIVLRLFFTINQIKS